MAYPLHLAGLAQVPALAEHHSRRAVYAVFVFLATALSIGAITAVAYWIGHPLVVPSLGPTAFLVFNRSQSSAAWPRNIVFGHLIGALAGYVALLAFGLEHAPSVLAGALTPSRIGAAGLSIALTSAVMILLHVEHGPAGATTLIVSLGFMRTPSALGLLMGGVFCLAVLGLLIDRAVGLKLPLWSGLRSAGLPGALASRLARFPVAASRCNGNGNGNGHHPGVAGRVGGTQIAERRPSGPSTLAPRVLSWGWPGRDPACSVVAPEHGRRVFTGWGRCTVKTEGARSGGSYSLLEVVFEPAETLTPLHSHFDFAETYFVLEGEVLAEVGTEKHRAPAGSTITVPAGVPHALTSSGRRPARCLCITDRALHSDLEYLP